MNKYGRLAMSHQGQRAATAEEQQTLARWSSWGAVPTIFDESRHEQARGRAELKRLLDADAYAAARRTTALLLLAGCGQ